MKDRPTRLLARLTELDKLLRAGNAVYTTTPRAVTLNIYAQDAAEAYQDGACPLLRKILATDLCMLRRLRREVTP